MLIEFPFPLCDPNGRLAKKTRNACITTSGTGNRHKKENHRDLPPRCCHIYWSPIVIHALLTSCARLGGRVCNIVRGWSRPFQNLLQQCINNVIGSVPGPDTSAQTKTRYPATFPTLVFQFTWKFRVIIDGFSVLLHSFFRTYSVLPGPSTHSPGLSCRLKGNNGLSSRTFLFILPLLPLALLSDSLIHLGITRISLSPCRMLTLGTSVPVLPSTYPL